MYLIPFFRDCPDWMSYAFWRGYRTWWQTFPSALLAWLLIYLDAGWDWRVFISVALIPPSAATLGWFSNRAAQEDLEMDSEQ